MEEQVSLPLLKPMLATSSRPFDSPDFLYEVKWDGYRVLAYLDGGTLLRSRNLRDITATFPELEELHKCVKKQPAIIDGEIVIFQDGRPSFAALQARGRLEDPLKIKGMARRHPAILMAFDVLYAGGRSLLNEPLRRRKELLAEMIKPGDQVLVSEFVLHQGRAFTAACVARGLEGVMAKHLDSPYLPGRRSPYWRKFRHTKEADLVICGYQAGRGRRRLGALLLGGYRGEELVYQGKVGTGFNREEEEHLLELLSRLVIPRPVLALPPVEARRTIAVEPVLVCAVEYLTLTAGGLLRHCSYRGLRLDKSPRDCHYLFE
ncbi:non-homologous end-joining DNA ligase [Desulfofundulus salinus]|uniref:DNA ligase (ATP) n=1 Tax=Desulfofundulus salinus TaxID=2419843 RepID=A0A494X2V7_9FIRM|nr:non-homologous end-joining DNA ligase [Desulfofundulus salinum]RKO67547.1 ATP-dependent DNA ligase [Desulfofundulus salinum]